MKEAKFEYRKWRYIISNSTEKQRDAVFYLPLTTEASEVEELARYPEIGGSLFNSYSHQLAPNQQVVFGEISAT